MNTETCIAEGAVLLEKAGIDNGRQEARWLMSQLMCEIPPCSVPCPADLPQWLSEEFKKRLQRRANGEPLQYIMGSAEFYNVELLVGPGVLIPRPETEQLVEIALKHLKGNTVCDLCTGSGAIALAIAKELPETTVTGIDISAKALSYAQRNKAQLGIKNATFILGDLFAPLPPDSKFSLITANPPYVTTSEYEHLDSIVHDYEPALALIGGEDGLDVLRRIAASAKGFLEPSGTLISEIGEEQGASASELFRKHGFSKVETVKDYSEKERFIIAVNT
jgi:release factor glutamine methyltransferase